MAKIISMHKVIIGYRIKGIIGSLTAVLGTIIPPMVIISIIAIFYKQFRSNVIIAIGTIRPK